MRPGPVERERPWLSASDLAEYAYCPRALYYRRQHTEAPDPPAARSGRVYHQRSLRAEHRRAAYAGAYWALLLVGLALVVIALLGGRLG